jgi:hypothetical protein
MDRDPKVFQLTRTDGDILFLSYVRPIDNFDWTYRCSNRVIWASEPDVGEKIQKTTRSPLRLSAAECNCALSVTAATGRKRKRYSILINFNDFCRRV